MRWRGADDLEMSLQLAWLLRAEGGSGGPSGSWRPQGPAGKCDFLAARPPAATLASDLGISMVRPTLASHSPAWPSPLRNICYSAYHANRLTLRAGQVFSTPARKHQNHIALQAFPNRQSSSNDSYGLADNKTHVTFALGYRWGYFVPCGGETKTRSIWE